LPAKEVIFAKSEHSADAIQRAAYKFTDRFAIELIDDGANLCCRLHPVEDVDGIGENTVSAFRSEVLDQVLRERIRDETEAARNLVLSLAFSNTGLNTDAAGETPAAGSSDEQVQNR
jgi:His-Xaa-Ser system protein HxsD